MTDYDPLYDKGRGHISSYDPAGAAPRADGLDVAAEVAYEMKVFLHGAKSAPPVAPGWLAQIEKWRARLSRPSDERSPIREVVGNGDGTMNVLLENGTRMRITEAEYLAWPRPSDERVPEEEPDDR